MREEYRMSSSGRLHLRRQSLELLQHAKRLQEKYILQPVWNNSSDGKINELNQIAEVEIAEAGCCKYILIEVQDEGITFDQSKFIVRADASCVDHLDLFDKIKEQFDETKLKLICQGGGRVQVDPAMRKIKIYGSSSEFGPADHYKAAEILRRKYRQWTFEITDEEY